MRDQREVTESPIDQGVHEAVAYQFDFTAAGVSAIVGLPACQLVRADGVDVSGGCMPSGPNGTALGAVATSPIVQSLADGQLYRLYARVTHDGGQVMELFCTLRGRL